MRNRPKSLLVISLIMNEEFVARDKNTLSKIRIPIYIGFLSLLHFGPGILHVSDVHASNYRLFPYDHLIVSYLSFLFLLTVLPPFKINNPSLPHRKLLGDVVLVLH